MMDHHHESSSKANCHHKHRGWILTSQHFILWLITADYSNLTYAEQHIWTTKCYGVQSIHTQLWILKRYSKTQQKELPLPLARHLLCSSLGGSQEIRQPLSPRNQFWCPLQRLASEDNPVINSILPLLMPRTAYRGVIDKGREGPCWQAYQKSVAELEV